MIYETTEVIYHFDSDNRLHNDSDAAIIGKLNGFIEYIIHGKIQNQLVTFEQLAIRRAIKMRYAPDEVRKYLKKRRK